MPILRQQLRQSPLAFPGRLPGFDATHPAAGSCRFSGITAGTGVINLLSGAKGTSAASPGSALNGTIGPNATFPNAGAGDSFRFNGTMTSAIDNTFTMGAIIVLTSVGSAAQWIMQSSSAASGVGININVTTAILAITIPGVSGPVSTIALQAGIPYFVAASANQTIPLQNYIVARLDNGQIFTSTSGTAGTPAANNGNLLIGNRSTLGLPLLGGIAASMFSTQFNSLRSLTQWAADPWAFWYPRSNYGAIDIGTLIAAGGFKAAWAQQNNYPVIGTGTY